MVSNGKTIQKLQTEKNRIGTLDVSKNANGTPGSYSHRLEIALANSEN